MKACQSIWQVVKWKVTLQNVNEKYELEKGIDLGQEFSEEEKKFVVFVVRSLFRRIEEGMVELDKDGMSETIKDLKAVVFDQEGDPIFETITARVRFLGKTVLMLGQEKLTREDIEREKNSPVHDYLEKPVEISNEILQKYSNENRLTELAFELYKESGGLLSVCAFLYSEDKNGGMILKRDQAICAGLLVRIVKFMTAVIQLSAETDRREVIVALSRCILESVINLRFLLKKNEKRFYDQYVKFSLAPERAP